MNIIYPQPESCGGWRYMQNEYEIRSISGMDPDLLERFYQRHLNAFGGWDWGITVIRHGAIVKEFFSPFWIPGASGRIWSCTKSFTGTAFGILFEDSEKGLLPNGQRVDLESMAYDFIPQGYLSDDRKKGIRIKHLLSMTSGIGGEITKGIYSAPADCRTAGPFEVALGKSPSRWGVDMSKMVGEPASVWDYSDPGFMHLSVIFSYITGMLLHEFMQDRVFAPAGIESAHWDVCGGGEFLGPYTQVEGGLNMTVRDLARFGYLLLHGGEWDGKQIISKKWIELATNPSQRLNPEYGYSFWTNAEGTLWPYLPRDAYALMGHCCSKCYIIPSLDLVVARLGTGPNNWFEPYLVGGIVDTIIH